MRGPSATIVVNGAAGFIGFALGHQPVRETDHLMINFELLSDAVASKNCYFEQTGICYVAASPCDSAGKGWK